MYLYELANATDCSTDEVLEFLSKNLGMRSISLTNDWVDPVLADAVIEALNPPRSRSIQAKFRYWALNKFAL